MARVRHYEDLIARQKACEMVVAVYEVSRGFPKDERFGLTTQVPRAAMSVPSNIAEGWARSSRRDLLRFLEMALGSCFELQTQTRIAAKLGYIEENAPIHEQISEVERVLSGLMKYLGNKHAAP